MNGPRQRIQLGSDNQRPRNVSGRINLNPKNEMNGSGNSTARPIDESQELDLIDSAIIDFHPEYKRAPHIPIETNTPPDSLTAMVQSSTASDLISFDCC